MLKINKEFTLPKEYKKEINLPLLAQAIYVYEERNHIGLRKAKTRSEVNRTTKKLYKQKGTGGARHGSRRANLFVGGGVVFGPRPEKRSLSISKQFRKTAKSIALSLKAKHKELALLAGLSVLAKTAEAGKFIKTEGIKKGTILVSDKNADKVRFLSNLENVKTILFKNANAFDVFKGGMILIDDDVFAKESIKKAAKSVVVKGRKNRRVTESTSSKE